LTCERWSGGSSFPPTSASAERTAGGARLTTHRSLPDHFHNRTQQFQFRSQSALRLSARKQRWCDGRNQSNRSGLSSRRAPQTVVPAPAAQPAGRLNRPGGSTGAGGSTGRAGGRAVSATQLQLSPVDHATDRAPRFPAASFISICLAGASLASCSIISPFFRWKADGLMNLQRT